MDVLEIACGCNSRSQLNSQPVPTYTFTWVNHDRPDLNRPITASQALPYSLYFKLNSPIKYYPMSSLEEIRWPSFSLKRMIGLGCRICMWPRILYSFDKNKGTMGQLESSCPVLEKPHKKLHSSLALFKKCVGIMWSMWDLCQHWQWMLRTGVWHIIILRQSYHYNGRIRHDLISRL